MQTAVLVATLAAVSPARGQTPVVRDSSGIRITENSLPNRGARALVRVEDRPTLQIGVQNGDRNYQFNDVAGATRLPDGTIAVADRGSGEIRFFDSVGRFVRKIGGKGQGPGEFRSLSDIQALNGGSLIAWDRTMGRFTSFAPAGAVTGTFTATGGPYSDRGVVVLIHGRLADGSFFGYRLARQPAPALEAVARDTLLVALFTPQGTYLRDVSRFLGYERLLHSGGSMTLPSGQAAPTYSVRGVPFARETLFRTSADGLYAGTGDTYEILRFDHAGALRQIIRVRKEPVRVTGAMIAQHRKEPRPTPTYFGLRMDADSKIDASWYPKTLPAYAALRVDDAERLWVQDYPIPGDRQRRWNVFDRDGTILGVVSLPPSVEVLEVGSSYLLGTWRDELEVEYLRVYTLSNVP